MTGLFQIGDKLLQAQDIHSLLKRYQLMPQFLRGVIEDQAIKSFTCTEEEIHAIVAQFYAQHQLTSPEAKAEWLQRQDMTEEEVAQMVVRPALIEKFKQATFSSKVDNYFLTRKSNLDQVSYSLIRTKNVGLAHELYFRIAEGEQTFEEVASKYSEGPEAQKEGKLGPVPISQPHPAISKLLSVSQEGQLWSPRALAEWMVIIRLDKFKPAQLNHEMRQHLINELFEIWLSEQLSKIAPLQPFRSSVSSAS